MRKAGRQARTKMIEKAGRGPAERRYSRRFRDENPGFAQHECTCSDVQDPVLPPEEVAHKEWCELMSPAARRDARRRQHPADVS